MKLETELTIMGAIMMALTIALGVWAAFNQPDCKPGHVNVRGICVVGYDPREER